MFHKQELPQNFCDNLVESRPLFESSTLDTELVKNFAATCFVSSGEIFPKISQDLNELSQKFGGPLFMEHGSVRGITGEILQVESKRQQITSPTFHYLNVSYSSNDFKRGFDIINS